MESAFRVTSPEFILSEMMTDSAYNVFSTNNTRKPFKGPVEDSSDPASCLESGLVGTEEKLQKQN